MKWRERSENPRWPTGIPKPCAPTRAAVPPTGSKWVHEIKHDGYRLIVRKVGKQVSVFTRGGYDWTARYPAIVDAASAVRAKSFILDGEGVVCDAKGVADFDLMHSRKHDRCAILYAFDLLELNGDDLRKDMLGDRKLKLERLLGAKASGVLFAEHIECEGGKFYHAACKLGLEGIISKRIDRAYVSGPCKHWIKVKNPDAPWRERLDLHLMTLKKDA